MAGRIGLLPTVALIAALAAPTSAVAADALGGGQRLTGTVSASGTSWRAHKVDVTAGTALVAKLGWPGSADLDLTLKDPTGTAVATSRTRGTAPETVRFTTLLSGTYTLGVKAVSGSATYSLLTTPEASDPRVWRGSVDITGTATSTVKIDVAQRSSFTVGVRWPSQTTDLNLFLKDPSGTVVAKATGQTGTIEVLTVADAAAGRWVVTVKARTGRSDFVADSHAVPQQSTSAEVSVRRWAAVNEMTGALLTRSEALEDARRHEVLIAQPETYAGHVAAMKAENPALRVYAYVNAMFAPSDEGSRYHDSWYAKDSSGGKISSVAYGNWLMNPLSTGWRDNRISACQVAMTTGPYDGCMLDMLTTAPLYDGYCTSKPVDPRTGSVYTMAAWQDATERVADAVGAGLSQGELTGNGFGSGPRYYAADAPTSALVSALDGGGIAESWLRTAHDPATSYRNETKWRQSVDMVVDAEARGGGVLAMVKVWSDATSAQRKDWYDYSLATFLLGTGSRSAFTFSGSPDTDPTVPGADVAIGTPTGAYLRLTNGAYRRDFTAGTVLVNPTTAAITVTLGATPYTTPTGLLVTSVTLRPHTGVILQR